MSGTTKDPSPSHHSAMHANIQNAHQPSPIQRIPFPPEILQEIFLFVRTTEDNKIRSPSVVSQICQHWRQIALSTPRLWTTVLVAFRPENIAKILEHLVTWLTRGAACSSTTLFVYRYYGKRYPRGFAVDDSYHTGVAFARAVSPYAGHLKFLVLKGDSQCFNGMYDTWEVDGTRFPNLEALEVDGWGENWEEGALRSICPVSPGLGVVLQRQLDSVMVQPDAPIAWHQTRAFGGQIPGPLLPQMLSRFTSIQILELDMASDCPETFPPAEFRSLTNLTSLSLLFEQFPRPSEDGIPPLPALRHLVLGSTFGLTTPDDDAPLFLLLLEAWGVNLLHLSLPEGLHPVFIGPALRHAPNLESLRTSHTTYAAAVPSSAIPRLRHLELLIRQADLIYPRIVDRICASLQTPAPVHLRALTLSVEITNHTYTPRARAGIERLERCALENDLVTTRDEQDRYAEVSFGTSYFRKLGGDFAFVAAPNYEPIPHIRPDYDSESEAEDEDGDEDEDEDEDDYDNGDGDEDGDGDATSLMMTPSIGNL